MARLRHTLVSATVAALVAMACLPAGAQAPTSPYRVVGYATQWLPSQDKDVGKIDTLIFAFAVVKDGRVVLPEGAAKKLQALIALKARSPALKVDISVGGWGAGGFSEAAGSAQGRQLFADTAAQLVVDYDADGVDIDWEYPGHHESGIASSPGDRANYTALLQAVRGALDRAGIGRGRSGKRHYTLSVAVADGPYVDHVDIPAVDREVDWFNLMTYDFCNALTPDTCHHAGLHASRYAPANARTTARAVRQFLAAGVPAHKLVIGAAFYGREFGGVNPQHDGLYQPYRKFIAFVPWAKLKSDFIGKGGFERHWDARADAAWLWNPKTRVFISYDDPASIAAKAAFVKRHHLGGMMYWEQSLDTAGELLDAIWRGLH